MKFYSCIRKCMINLQTSNFSGSSEKNGPFAFIYNFKLNNGVVFSSKNELCKSLPHIKSLLIPFNDLHGSSIRLAKLFADFITRFCKCF